jgi:hypothetical protein
MFAAIGICPRAVMSSCPETASFVTEGDDGLSADAPEPSDTCGTACACEAWRAAQMKASVRRQLVINYRTCERVTNILIGGPAVPNGAVVGPHACAQISVVTPGLDACWHPTTDRIPVPRIPCGSSDRLLSVKHRIRECRLSG